MTMKPFRFSVFLAIFGSVLFCENAVARSISKFAHETSDGTSRSQEIFRIYQTPSKQLGEKIGEWLPLEDEDFEIDGRTTDKKQMCSRLQGSWMC